MLAGMGVRIGEREVRLMRDVVRFPVELRTPEDFDAAQPQTWPSVDGRLEYVGGRLLFMPPTGDVQQDVVVDVAYVLRSWSKSRAEFVVGSNEAGMILGGDTRGADGAVWRRADLGERTGGFRRVAPVLAVEVAGRDDEETALTDKAAWYLSHGVEVVWLVLPASREVVVVDAAGSSRYGREDVLPPRDALPGLQPAVRELFAQIDAP